MTKLTVEDARKMARILFDMNKNERTNVLASLDSDFKMLVKQELLSLNDDAPLDKRDTVPMKPVFPLYPGHHDNS